MDNNLPKPPKAVGNYTTIKKVNNIIYTSGHVPISEEKKFIGKIPNEQSTEEGYEAASLCAELTLATLSEYYDLEKLNPINIVGFVNCTDDYTDHPKVLNGFTDKLEEYFNSKATRSAVGVSSLPMNVSVEVQTIFYIDE
jgi:enamine deaminase RidA (YjgF/YER057c/UK114 family)